MKYAHNDVVGGILAIVLFAAALLAVRLTSAAGWAAWGLLLGILIVLPTLGRIAAAAYERAAMRRTAAADSAVPPPPERAGAQSE
ncbi:MAG TPA: hypothetical protein VJT31_25025 [Rugosimonospora sp.]|nr:hypothetical protein [Rugosimonospora sp.]